jgi:hypothetical protein
VTGIRAKTLLRLGLPAAVLAPLLGCGPRPQQISESGFGAYEVSVSAWPDGLVVAWYDTRDGNAEVYVRLLDAAGQPTGGERRLTHTVTESYEADVAATRDGFAVAWYEKSRVGLPHAQLAWWHRNGDGGPLWQDSLSAPERPSRNAVVRAHGDALFAAWIESDGRGGEHVRAGWWNLDGSVRLAPVTLGAAGDTTWNLNAAVDGGGTALVVFDARVGTYADELYLAELAPDGGTALVRLSDDDGRHSKYPDLALGGDDSAALTWFDERDRNREVYLAMGSLAELRSGGVATARRVTTTPGESIGAYVAVNAGRIGLAWCDDSGGAFDIYTQTFRADGTLEAPPARVATNAQSLIPAIHAWGGGFVAAWTELEGAPHERANRSEVVVAFVP